METKKIERRGMNFYDALTLIFITLKLCGVISWSWVWVLSPMWISGIFVLAFVILSALAE